MVPVTGWREEDMPPAGGRAPGRPCTLGDPGEPESGQGFIPWLAVLAVNVQHIGGHAAGQTEVVVGVTPPPRSNTPRVSGGILHAVIRYGHLAARPQWMHWDSAPRVEDCRPTQRAQEVGVVGVVLA